MTTDFRALCAELTEFVARLTKHYYEPAELLTRARAALAEPEPVGPTLRQLMLLADDMDMASVGDAAEYARAVLARWGHTNSTLVPSATEQPTDEDLLNLHEWMTDEWAANHDFELPLSQYARAVLARWGSPELLQRQALVPVPVSERLPRPSDCAPWPKDSDASAWCWVGTDEDGGWEWEQRSAGCLAMFPDSYTHWLPAHALPLPKQIND